MTKVSIKIPEIKIDVCIVNTMLEGLYFRSKLYFINIMLL